MSNTTSASASATHASDQYNQIQTKQELMSMLLEGKLSGEKEGWLSSEEAKIILRKKQ
ncbi:hypothetical protein HNQ46_000977 [Oribacterium sinus]|uniref:Uncharacterized protein n=1 Tax=Oribacterium sinus TaxID=237576 RepID=A0A7W9SGM8_9FIRM|nr:hypothetical protein [Oribacterium sinus]MBB6041005.1 hypothetical protein [Oribacterium sinus]